MPDYPHEASAEGTISEMEFFTLPVTQTTVEESEFVEYHPVSAITSRGPIEFFVSGASDTYIDCSQTFIQVRVKVTNADGTDLAADAPVTTVNLFLHSLFSQVDVLLNERLCSASDNNYPYRALLETLLCYVTDAKTSQLTLSGYHKDPGGKMAVVNPQAADAPSGIKARYEKIKTSNTWELLGRIHSDIFSQPMLLLNGVDLRLRFTRSKDAFCLMSSSQDPSYAINVTKASLFVRKVTPTPSVLLAHSQALRTQNVKYPVRRVECKVFTVPAGNMQASLDNAFLGQYPSRLILGIVSNPAYSGSYATNPFNFAHNNVNFLTVTLDGKVYLSQPYQPDFGKSLVAREYLSLFQATGKFSRDEGLDISLERCASTFVSVRL